MACVDISSLARRNAFKRIGNGLQKGKNRKMKNIGFVIYRKGNEPGTLLAQWYHSDDGSGTGIAKGSPSEGFVGEYQIRYFDERGNVQAARELVIKKDREYYQLSWLKDGTLSAEGIGQETSGCLCVGYHNI
jgi:hypothetical protein